jgi:hypothetical protein
MKTWSSYMSHHGVQKGKKWPKDRRGADAAAASASTLPSRTSEVHEHARWFSEPGSSAEELTHESMRDGHRRLGITSGVAFKSGAIRGLLKRRGCPYTAEAISKVENPARSGIWDADGKFNEAQFMRLASGAMIDSKGQKVVTRDMFSKFTGKHPRSGELATWAYFGGFIPVPLTWNMITTASLDELFKYYANSSISGEPAITVSRLRLFYTNPTEFFTFPGP